MPFRLRVTVLVPLKGTTLNKDINVAGTQPEAAAGGMIGRKFTSRFSKNGSYFVKKVSACPSKMIRSDVPFLPLNYKRIAIKMVANKNGHAPKEA